MALTPYQGQYKNLKAIRERLATPALAVRKIDSSQGDERPVVVFSATQTKKVGFMRSSNRLNVATSRQQAGFFAFGNLALFEHDPTWRAWMTAFYHNPHPGCKHFKVTKRCKFLYQAPATVQGLSQNPDSMNISPVNAPTTDPLKPPSEDGEIGADLVREVLAESQAVPQQEVPGPPTDMAPIPSFANKYQEKRYWEFTKIISTWPSQKREAVLTVEAAAKLPLRQFNQIMGDQQKILTDEELNLICERIELLRMEQ